MHLAALPMAKVRISKKHSPHLHIGSLWFWGGDGVGAWVVEGKELRCLCLRMESGQIRKKVSWAGTPIT